MSLFNDIKDLFVKPTHKRMVEKEIDESERLLLQSHTNKEHWQSQVELHTLKLKRLRTTWNKITEEHKDG